MFCHDIHCNLAKIQIISDPGCRSDPGRIIYILDHCPRKFLGIHLIGMKIRRRVDHHFIDRIHMNVFRRNVFQIDLINLRADLHIFCHPRRSDKIIHRVFRGTAKHCVVHGFPGKFTARRFSSALRIDQIHFLYHFKQTCPPRDPVGFQCRRHGKTDRLFRPAFVRHNEIGRHRI